ncbi:MAG: TolC family outer membrane protein [Rhodobacteraceae bacterium]|nr:TolC family outer membrane protein [Paracoccaceae bacterium]
MKKDQMRYSAVCLGLVLSMLGGIGNAQSLTDAMISAYRNSPQLKSEQAALRSVDEGVAQAVGAIRPSLSMTASTGFIHSFRTDSTTRAATLALSAQMVLWDGGTTKLAIEAARMNVVIGRESLVDVEQSILLNAATAFMNMRRDTQSLQLAENSGRVILRQVQAAKDRFEVGEVRRTDVSQAEARYAGARSTIALQQGTLEISRESYFVATGTYPGALQPPPPLPKLPATLEDAKSIAMRNHPAILRARHLAELAEINVFRAEAAMKPTISISGNLGVNANLITGDSASLSIGGNAPIYSGGQLTSAYRQALALREKSLSDIQLTGLQVTRNVTLYWSQLKIARASISARQQEVNASRIALRGIREEADLGARTTLDVLDAESETFAAETNLVTAIRDENVAAYSLLSAMGLLTVQHLKLGIKTYDTNANYKKVYLAPGPTNRGELLDKIFTRAGRK